MIDEENVESEIYTLSSAKQEVLERGPAMLINTSDVTIENGALNVEAFAVRLSEILETAEHVPIPGDNQSRMVKNDVKARWVVCFEATQQVIIPIRDRTIWTRT